MPRDVASAVEDPPMRHAIVTVVGVLWAVAATLACALVWFLVFVIRAVSERK